MGRRGSHTRNKIKSHAAELFIAKGYHATSVDAIAKAMGRSRATVYQYFTSKEAIYAELVLECEDAVLAHARTLGGLGPHAEGLRNLRVWLHEWADIYDAYAVVLLEFPGIGDSANVPVTDAGTRVAEFRALITERLVGAGIAGLDATDAANALMRISHMVNLYRYRGMFDLPTRATTSNALAIALQLMLFPTTPSDVIAAGPAPDVVRSATTGAPLAGCDHPAATPGDTDWPARQDVLAVSSTLFAERGYYSVSMDDIAAAADISRATLYRYYSSKTAVLAELTASAVGHSGRLATDLTTLAQTGFDTVSLQAWMSRYVHFHRTFNGVIRAWFDGAVAEQLSGTELRGGIDAMREAVTAVLDRTALPEGMDRRAATAIVMAVLGRMTEPAEASSSSSQDADRTAELMVLLLERSLLRSWSDGETGGSP